MSNHGTVINAEEITSLIGKEDSRDMSLETISDIPIEVTAVLGRTMMPVNKLLKLGRGAVVILDKKVGESVDVYVNDRLVAYGEVIIVENKIGITMTEIVKSDDNE